MYFKDLYKQISCGTKLRVIHKILTSWHDGTGAFVERESRSIAFDGTFDIDNNFIPGCANLYVNHITVDADTLVIECAETSMRLVEDVSDLQLEDDDCVNEFV